MKKTILIFGNGYVAKFLSKTLSSLGWNVYCTSRKIEILSDLKSKSGITLINFFDKRVSEIIKVADAILSTIPQDYHTLDPALLEYTASIKEGDLQWLGYLSSTGVYGDHKGEWVTEATLCKPTSTQSETRLLAEDKWLDLYIKYNLPVHVFRLSGIYGPGRNCLEDISRGKDFTVVKKGQYFSRTHIEDICMAIISSINFPTPGEIYNISDDEPAPVDVVQQFGATLLNKNPLREIPLEDADLSDQARIFFQDNKKVSGKKVTQKLGIKWRYPNYRSGLLDGCFPYL